MNGKANWVKALNPVWKKPPLSSKPIVTHQEAAVWAFQNMEARRSISDKVAYSALYAIRTLWSKAARAGTKGNGIALDKAHSNQAALPVADGGRNAGKMIKQLGSRNEHCWLYAVEEQPLPDELGNTSLGIQLTSDNIKFSEKLHAKFIGGDSGPP